MEKTNRLSREKSPYLLEHALNPVDWFPWGREALAKAKNDNKPIFLSVGYSTCHWCHVMRRESFEDAKTAAFINRHFIPIKVDREERPEVDAYYMGAVQVMTGGGGWPLSVFLTPDLKPFYGGTYYPPEPRYGMPSFMQVLEFVAGLWKDKREEVRANSEQVLKSIRPESAAASGAPSKSALDEGYVMLLSSYDEANGGFGRAPKFPLPGTLSFLLRYYHRTGKQLALGAVLKTLDGVMSGGIRDHVGGGFHRYSTDRVWMVPHFEKMLYDNALLARTYAEAFQITRNDEYAQVARETLGWVVGEMRDAGGGFYSAQDADTLQGEGAYYSWTPGELESVLGRDGAGRFGRLYGVTKNGNFEGRSLLHLELGTPLDPQARRSAAKDRLKLYAERIKRPRPATDTKIMTSWNGLAISSLAFCGLALGEGDYRKEAGQAADFVLRTNMKGGRLLRRYAGGEAGLDGTLEDYAFFVRGLLDLFEADPDPRWLGEAMRLTDVMVEELGDREQGGFFLAAGAEPATVKESYDGPTPSGNSVAAMNLIRLAELTGAERYRKLAQGTVGCFGGELERQPSSHTTMLAAVDMLLNGTREVVVTAPTPGAAAAMKSELFRGYFPDMVVLTATEETYAALSKQSCLLEGRRPGRKARAFVCRNFACKLPADSLDALREQLSGE